MMKLKSIPSRALGPLCRADRSSVSRCPRALLALSSSVAERFLSLAPFARFLREHVIFP